MFRTHSTLRLIDAGPALVLPAVAALTGQARSVKAQGKVRRTACWSAARRRQRAGTAGARCPRAGCAALRLLTCALLVINSFVILAGAGPAGAQGSASFFDDFESAASTGANWNNEAGDWRVLDGRYDAAITRNENPPSVSTVKNLVLTDFSIEVDIHHCHNGGIPVRLLDVDNFVLLTVVPEGNSLYWHVREGGNWGPFLNEAPLNAQVGDDLHVKLYNQGAVFFAEVYRDGVLISTNQLDTTPYGSSVAPSGRVGLYDFAVEQSFDNFRAAGDPPAAPSNLSATAVSQTRIDLAWQDNAGSESGFRVERWNGSVFVAVASLGANVTSYSNTGLVAATTYRYRVIAFNAGRDSAPSNMAEATTLPNPPAAPSNLVATPLSRTEIRLTWNENAANEDGIEVWRSTGGPFALHAGLGPNQTSYLDQGLAPATLYIYQMLATNAGGNSPFSNQAGATTLPNPPAAPSGLTATAVSGSQINLAWGDNATNETEFILEVSTDGGTTFAFLTTRPANSTSHSHTGLESERTYHYRAKARNGGGDSAWSNVAFATTPQVPPATPTNLTAAALSASEIWLSWNDVSGEQGFRIERRQGNDPFAFLANVGPNTATHTDGGLQANKVYVYRMLAFNAAGDSGWSNEASARTLRTRPRPPHSLTATAISATQVDLAWGDDNEDEQGFLLERSENAGAAWSQVASLPANVTRASDTSAQGGKNYQYRLKAWNDVGQSEPSNVASVSTPASVALASLTVTPASVRGRRNATGKVTLTGAAPSGGVSVTLASSNAAASVPSSVTVPAGATEATFTVTTARVRRNTRVTLTATLAAVQKTATLTVKK